MGSLLLPVPPQHLSHLINQLPSFLVHFPPEDDNLTQYFDFRAYERDQLEAMSGSSENSTHTPALTTDSTTTPPSDHYENPEGHHHDISSLEDARKRDDKWTYPQADPRQIPRDPLLMFPGSGSGPGSGSANGKRSAPAGPPSASRKRHLPDKTKTADVRDNGACVRCRIRRVGCEVGVCKSCIKFAPPRLSQILCVHEHLTSIDLVFNSMKDLFKQDRYLRRNDFIGKISQVPIAFSNSDKSSPTLSICVQKYQDPRSSSANRGKNCAIPRDRTPRWEHLVNWAGKQIVHEQGRPFKRALDNFMFHYALRNEALPKRDLVNKVWTMVCMFRIWRTNAFYYRAPSGSQCMPPQVTGELRHIAKKAMETLERDIMSDLEACMTQPGQVKLNEKPLLWACLWQLLLMYNQLLTTWRRSHASIGNVPPEAHRCTQIAERLFTVLVVFYSSYFHKPKSLDLELELSRVPRYVQSQLRDQFRAIIELRTKFYHNIQDSPGDFHEMLETVIVNSELKRLKRSRRKTAMPTAMSDHMDEDDDDDEDMDY